jgi:hypothetical protein
MDDQRRVKERTVPKHQPKKRWSADVTEHLDALDLESKVFEKKSAEQIAKSLKRSAESSDRRKSSPFQSAMSMLTFYMNRAAETFRRDAGILSKRPRENYAPCSDATRKTFSGQGRSRQSRSE